MSTYETTNTASLALAEQYLYGSSRLGVLEKGSRSYELTDHLGNVRAVVNEFKEVKAAYEYYAFGMSLAKVDNGYRYGFNGKERETGFTADNYNFGARIYDARTGRWLAVDQLANEYSYLSPYCFVGNMPVSAIDPDGKRIFFVAGAGDFGSYVDPKTFPGLHPTLSERDGNGNGTSMTTLFQANNQVTVDNFHAVVMNSFLNGGGPEDFYFGKDHPVSQSLSNSKLVEESIELFEEGKEDDKNFKQIRAGAFVTIDIGEVSVFGMLYRAVDHGTPLTPEHLIGSANVKITLSEDKKNYNITIWNVTSVGSGSLGMDKYVRKNKDDRYTNVSQTYELTVPVKEKE